MSECENCFGRVLPIKLRRYGTTEPPTYVCAVCGPTDKPVLDLATDIPMDDCGLHINTGRDGTWLHFDASNGQACSINVDVMAARADGIRGSALHQWCADRGKQSAEIKADNGQFGAGA